MTKIERNTNAGWVKPVCLENNDNLIKIMNFYLLKTPCENTSSMSISLSNYKWNKDTCNRLFQALMECAGLVKNETYQIACTIDEMSLVSNNVGFNNHFNKQRDINRLVLFHNKKKPLIYSLLFYIRCSFAHGRFAIYNDNNKTVYALEAIKNSSSRFMAVLSEELLLKWIEIIEGGPSKLLELEQKNINSHKMKILDLMANSTSRITKTYISSTLRIKIRILNKVIKEMKKDNSIVYNNSKKQWEIIDDKQEYPNKRKLN